jgi:hypothetical protein
MKSWVLAASLLAAAFVPAAGAADLGDDYGGYTERYRVVPPAYDDDDDGPPPPRRYSEAPYGRTCARSDEVRDRLGAMGWREFQGGEDRGTVVILRARRPNGRLFELTMHRCSGEIVEARPLEPRPVGPFAFNRPPREFYDERWDSDHPRHYRRW